MNVSDSSRAAMKRPALQNSARLGIVRLYQASMSSSGCEREDGGPIAALGRYCQIISFPQPHNKPKSLCRCWPRRHGDDMINIGIAVDNADRTGEQQHVDYRIRPSSPQAANEWRS